MTQTIAARQGREQAADENAIRRFHVEVPEAELTELRRRINATRFPERETVTDSSQGVPLGTVQKLARYWATGCDWREVVLVRVYIGPGVVAPKQSHPGEEIIYRARTRTNGRRSR